MPNQQPANKSLVLQLAEAEEKVLEIREKQRELVRQEEDLWRLIGELREQVYKGMR